MSYKIGAIQVKTVNIALEPNTVSAKAARTGLRTLNIPCFGVSGSSGLATLPDAVGARPFRRVETSQATANGLEKPATGDI